MAKTKTGKITTIEEEIRQLENKRRQLVQEQKAQERKDRTKRLCRRMGLFESMLPDPITLTDEQFKTFLEQTVAVEHSRRILNELTARNAAIAAVKGPVTGGAVCSAAKAAHTAQEHREDGSADGDAAQRKQKTKNFQFVSVQKCIEG